MGGNPVFLSRTAFANIIVMDWNASVQSYLSIVVANGGIPEQFRPRYCLNCGQKHQLLHRHGKYMRMVITLEVTYELPIYLFHCPLTECKSTFSLIPDFVEKHHQVALDLKEVVIRKHDQGTSLAQLASDSTSLPSGPYSEKTFWRWTSVWKERLEHTAAHIWSWILTLLPHMELWSEQARRRSLWGGFFELWGLAQHRLPQYNRTRFVHLLHRHVRSLALAVRATPSQKSCP
ncbi:hypothetical protein D3C85_837950 [compost metagenome]